jgi:serine/threonine-protein kinase
MTVVGERLGPFLMLDRIGSGGMGEVWLAQPVAVPGTRGLCVVKTMRAEVADDADALRRFADETRLAMLLHHPHISRVVDAGRANGIRYLGLDLVEGIDLYTLMQRLAAQQRTVDESVVLWIAACALDALAFAHAAKHPLTGGPLGVVHRDISPQNIMCARSGNAHVIDFGLALSSVKQARTAQDIVLGKLAYMAPEQARGDPVDARCDIFALGVVLYEIVAGRRYWGELAHHEIWQRAGREQWMPPGFADLASDIKALLAPMIARSPQARAHDAAERLEALTPLLLTRGGPAAATRQLAQLVEEHAAFELERVARARATMVAHVEYDAPTETSVDPHTESFALNEAAAVMAALASPTLALPAFTLPRMMPAVIIGTAARVTRDDLAAGARADLGPSNKRPLAAVAMGLLVLAALVALGIGAVLTQRRINAPAQASVTAPPPPVPVPLPDPIRTPPAPFASGVEAGPLEARPQRRTLDERLGALARCSESCAAGLRQGQANGALEALRGAGRTSVESVLSKCELRCKKR